MKALFIFDGSPGDFVLAMTAVEGFANANDDATIHICCDKKYEELAAGAWFIKKVYDLDGVYTEDGYDFVHSLTVNREIAAASEQAFKEKRIKEIDAYIKKMADDYKIKESDIPKPPDYELLKVERQTWHAMQGYCHAISKASGREVTLRSLELCKLKVKDMRKRTNSYIHQNRHVLPVGKPFVVIEGLSTLLKQGYKLSLPDDWFVLDASTLDPWLVVGAVSHKLCRGVIGYPGLATYAAWAHDIHIIVDVFDKADDANWLGTRSENTRGVALDADPDNKLILRDLLLQLWQLHYGIDPEDCDEF